MAFLQSTYSETMPIGAVGMKANSEEWNAITRTAGGSIGFGQPCLRSGDHGTVIAAAGTLTGTSSNGSPAPAGATITASPTATAGTTKIGVYRVICITAGTTGKWAVYDPDGNYVGQATTGTPATIDGLAFTITDSGTDPAIGEVLLITVASDQGTFLGLSIRDVGLGHASGPDIYAQYDNVAIMTMGVMWVTAGATVVAGDAVYWNPSTGRYTATVTHVRIPGARFDSGGADGDLVKVAIR